jgi:hypothetical protein
LRAECDERIALLEIEVCGVDEDAPRGRESPRLRRRILEARGGIEPPIMVLQTLSTIVIRIGRKKIFDLSLPAGSSISTVEKKGMK